MPIKRLLLYALFLTSPFLLMVVVNEATKTKAYTIKLFGTPVDALNPANQMESQCTWDCHNKGCSHRDKNVISLGPVDTLRSKIIKSLGVSNGDTYQTMNILILVILWPLLMFGLVVANIELYRTRQKNK